MELNIDNTSKDKWECFLDSAYYDMWAVKTPSMLFQETFHLVSKDEAQGLVKLLNKYGVKSK